jgi:hypothetical protein
VSDEKPPRSFPPGTDESHIRWLVYKDENSQWQIAAVVDYMQPEIKPEDRPPGDDLWVCPVEPGRNLAGMGAHIRADRLHQTRLAALEEHVEYLRKKLAELTEETARWQDMLSDEKQCCPQCGVLFTTNPRRHVSDRVCETCFDDNANPPIPLA